MVWVNIICSVHMKKMIEVGCLQTSLQIPSFKQKGKSQGATKIIIIITKIYIAPISLDTKRRGTFVQKG